MKLSNAISRARLGWCRWFGGWSGVERSAWLHWSVDFRQPRPGQIAIGKDCVIERSTWLNVPTAEAPAGALTLGEGCAIGRNNVISAKNSIRFEAAVVTGPQVLVMDHAHAYEEVTRPILHQGVTKGGSIVIETGCWLGFGCCVVANRGELRIGRNSVVAANAVVTSSVPPMTIVAGTPARPIRAYNDATGLWERVEEPCPQHS